jgi:PAS domain S-box-containing protein
MAYGVAVLATVVATVFRLALIPLIGDYAIPFITYFPAVLLSAWYGGFRAGVLNLLLSTAVGAYMFSYPPRSFRVPSPTDQISLVIFLMVGFSLALISGWLRRALKDVDKEASLRGNAESAERSERQRFEITLASIGEGVIATDNEGQVRFINTAAEVLTGWKRDDAVAKPIETVFHIVDETTRKPIQLPIVRAIQKGRSANRVDHTILIAKDGTQIPVEESGSIITDYEGRPAGAVLIFRDIGERRRIESEREASARTVRQLAAIVESSDDAIISKGLDLRITSWNHAAERMLGYTASEAIGQPLAMIIPKNRLGEEESLMLRIRRGDRVEHLETERRRKDGVVIPVSLAISPVHDTWGRVVGSSTTMRNLTEKRRAEREREASTRIACQLASIVESSDDAILGKSLDLRITSWNRAAERMFGYTASEAIGQSVSIIIPDDRWSEEENFMQSIRRGENVGHHETERRHKDGSIIPVAVTISPIHDTARNVVGASTIMRDITRQRAAEKEREARLAAEEANRTKDEFLAVLSHELRNPLSAIIGWMAVLKQGQVPAERVPHVFNVIDRNARAESQLVESLLDFSRIAARKLDLHMEGVYLSSLVEIVVESMRPAADAKGISLTLTPAQKPLIVVGDSDRLQQVFSNLLTNAIKFTPRDGHVQVRLVQVESQAQVQFIDDGEGIHPDFLPCIFERFRQADSAKGRAHGGLGLGLAIVRELADAHGGTVTAESPGKGLGSTFTVTIPIPAVLPENIKMATVHDGNEEPVISGLRILVVDDEADARELVTLTLQSRGAVIQQASSAGEALATLGGEKPDLVISDIGMPHEDGYVLIQKLRAAERERGQPRLPAIALTTYSSPSDRDQALAWGYDLHLAKPVSQTELVRAVADMVSQSRSAELDKPRKSA